MLSAKINKLILADLSSYFRAFLTKGIPRAFTPDSYQRI